MLKVKIVSKFLTGWNYRKYFLKMLILKIFGKYMGVSNNQHMRKKISGK